MGFFDGIQAFFAPISKPLVSFSTKLSGQLLDTLIPNQEHIISQTLARPDVQNVGNQLFDVAAIAGIGIGAGAVAAPLLATAGVGGAGSLAGLGGIATQLPKVLPNLVSMDDMDGIFNDDPQDIFYDGDYDSGDS